MNSHPDGEFYFEQAYTAQYGHLELRMLQQNSGTLIPGLHHTSTYNLHFSNLLCLQDSVIQGPSEKDS